MSDRQPLAPVENLRKEAIPPPKKRAQAGPRSGAMDDAQGEQSRAADKTDTASRGDRRRAQQKTAVFRSISLSIPVTLVKELKSWAREKERAQADIVLDAVSTHHDGLSDLVAKRRRQMVSDGLFTREVPQSHNDSLMTLPLRLRADNVDTLDRLTTETNADSRSQLCVAALAAYLGID